MNEHEEIIRYLWFLLGMGVGAIIVFSGLLVYFYLSSKDGKSDQQV